MVQMSSPSLLAHRCENGKGGKRMGESHTRLTTAVETAWLAPG